MSPNDASKLVDNALSQINRNDAQGSLTCELDEESAGAEHSEGVGKNSKRNECSGKEYRANDTGMRLS